MLMIENTYAANNKNLQTLFIRTWTFINILVFK